MSKVAALCLALSLCCATASRAEDAVTCRGTITSKQGEGMVVRTFRFEVDRVSGRDLDQVLENCRKLAKEKQNRAAKSNPGVPFRNFSDVDLRCSQGGEGFEVKRTVQTAP